MCFCEIPDNIQVDDVVCPMLAIMYGFSFSFSFSFSFTGCSNNQHVCPSPQPDVLLLTGTFFMLFK